MKTFRRITIDDKLRLWIVSCLLLTALSLGGCGRITTSRNSQLIKEADWKAAQGEYLWAINLYEAALDGTPQSAEVHYKLALLYDDKMNDPLHALHHFKRYLILNENGVHANEVREFIKRDQVALATNLSGDSVLTRAEAARLRNENLNLHKQIETQSPAAHAVADKPKQSAEKESAKHGDHTYVVKDGDTLASISRKFYKTSKRWKEILEANKKKIDDPDNLKAGASLTIPSND